MIDELEEGDLVREEVDVGDSSCDCSGNSPENNHGSHKGNGCSISNDKFPPFDAQIRPDNLSRVKTNVTRCHVERKIVCDCKED